MPIAEIIAIGTELLLGEILDTNTQFLAKELNRIGVDIYRTMVIGDNPRRIQQTIQENLARSDIVITTGGLGPTIDDPTRQAAADATDSKLVFLPELWTQIEKRFEKYGRKASENNRRQAFVPQNAMVINNPVGTAPAFLIELKGKVLICLPGVPAEMRFLFQETVQPFLIDKFALNNIIQSVIIHSAGIGESNVDELISDLETMQNPTIGLTAYPGRVDIRVTAKATSPEEALMMIDPVVNDLYKRLGNKIYGKGEITLQEAISEIIYKKQIEIDLIVNEEIIEFEADLKRLNLFKQVKSYPTTSIELKKQVQRMYNENHNIATGVHLTNINDRVSLFMVFCSQKGCISETRYFAGHPSLTIEWVKNIFLNFLRCILLE